MTDDHYKELKTDIGNNTRITQEILDALRGTTDGKKGLHTRVDALENTVNGPPNEPQLGLVSKVRGFDNTLTKVVAYGGGVIAVLTAFWFVYDKVFHGKVPQF